MTPTLITVCQSIVIIHSWGTLFLLSRWRSATGANKKKSEKATKKKQKKEAFFFLSSGGGRHRVAKKNKTGTTIKEKRGRGGGRPLLSSGGQPLPSQPKSPRTQGRLNSIKLLRAPPLWRSATILLEWENWLPSGESPLLPSPEESVCASRSRESAIRFAATTTKKTQIQKRG
jgi:hypothetical protein